MIQFVHFNLLKLPSLLILVLTVFGSVAQEPTTDSMVTIGFYNLENLFDTIDTPNVRDWEYTPAGKKKWDSEKYFSKLTNISKVIADMDSTNNSALAILGVAEIENKAVLEDLVVQTSIVNKDYQIIHYNSRDKRGIDVALIYQPEYFTVQSDKSYRLAIEGESRQFTRDQLVVSGHLLGEPVTIMVAHWPSRYGGQSASERKRIAAAKLSRHIIDSVFTNDAEAKIILMGDFNDDPDNKSIKNYIRASGNVAKLKNNMLYNPMADLHRLGIGTLTWGGIWNLFDQIMVSQAFLSTEEGKLSFNEAKVFKKPYMVQSEGKYKGYPKRTTAGGKYLGGYSDHFPVYMTLSKKIE